MSAGLGNQPSRLPATDLADAFGPPNRAAGLAGRLTQLPSRSEPVPAPEAPQNEEGVSRPPGQKGAGERPRRRRAEQEQTAAPVQPIIVYLSASLRDRLRHHATSTGRSYTELTLEALDATHRRLGDLVADATSATTRPGSLFTGAPRPRRLRHDEPQVQVSLRLLRQDIDVIDRLVTDLQAPNRSSLVATALGAHLS